MPEFHWHIFFRVMHMKRTCTCLLVAVAALLLSSSVPQSWTASIRGRITPYNAAVNVWAVSDTDTSRSSIQNGEFEIKKLHPGRYRVIVNARRPYRVTTKTDVIIADSTGVDVGNIVLDQ